MWKAVFSCLCYIVNLSIVLGSATLKLTLLELDNPAGTDHLGYDCDSALGFSTSRCDHKIVVCVDTVSSRNSITSSCAYLRKDLGIYENRNKLSLGGSQYTYDIGLSTWPGAVKIKVEVIDHDRLSYDDFVGLMVGLIQTSPKNVWQEMKITHHQRNKNVIAMKLRYMLNCDSHYYGLSCSVFCNPQNTGSNDHCTCASDGRKICREVKPTVAYCPLDKFVIATDVKTEVAWRKPTFKKPLNHNLKISSTFNAETALLPKGRNRIVYVATSEQNNKSANCTFFITVSRIVMDDYLRCHGPLAMNSKGKKSMYTYNARTDRCEMFKKNKCFKMWKNAFKSMKECEDTCKLNSAPVCIQVSAEFGMPCTNKSYDVPTWSYNYANKKCELFNYAGCYGNHNRFHSKQACHNNCPDKCENWKWFANDPCSGASCPAEPRALCVTDNCSNTRDHYFIRFGYEIDCDIKV